MDQKTTKLSSDSNKKNYNIAQQKNIKTSRVFWSTGTDVSAESHAPPSRNKQQEQQARKGTVVPTHAVKTLQWA